MSMSMSPSTFESLVPSRYLTFTLPLPSSQTHLHISILDSPTTIAAATTAAMFVPANREKDWTFTTFSGHLQLLLTSPQTSRLILIANHNGIHNLKPLLSLLSLPQDRQFEIPILTYHDNILTSNAISLRTGKYVGDILVEDIQLCDGSFPFRRRLRFKRMPNLVQTEMRLKDGSPDVEVLVHPYLEPMVASLSLVRLQIGRKGRALCVGVGGGAVVSFLRRKLVFEVDGVEVDEEVLRVAREYFGLEDGDGEVFVGDAVEVVTGLAERGSGKYDVVMVDLDSSDAVSGVSAPPLEFIEKRVLLAVKAILYDHGVVAMNVIPPSREFYEGLKRDFRDVFPELYEIDVGNGENFVVIAAASPVVSFGSDLEDAFVAKLRSLTLGTYIDSIKKIEVSDQRGNGNFN